MSSGEKKSTGSASPSPESALHEELEDEETKEFMPDPEPVSHTEAAATETSEAQVSNSPYLTPFTPFQTPSAAKTPTNAPSAGPRKQAKKTPTSSPSAAAEVVKEEELGQDLPTDLVEHLVANIENLDALIYNVENFSADQLTSVQKQVNEYVRLLQQIDSSAANYHASIPVEVLEMLDGETDTNPELFTKSQLERCEEESSSARVKIDSLGLLKSTLDGGLQDLSQNQ